MQPNPSTMNPYMGMNPCMYCPYMMQGQYPNISGQQMGMPYMAPGQCPMWGQYQTPGQYPTQPSQMKREGEENPEEDETRIEDDDYRFAPFGRPRPFSPPFLYPRPFFPPFFFPFFF